MQKRAEHTIDASGRPVGRIATEAARLLIGKHKATYKPEVDDGDTVRVVNASKIRWSGKKLESKTYKHATGFLGGLKTAPTREIFAADPAFTVRHAVSSMLPKNSHRTPRLKRLIITV